MANQNEGPGRIMFADDETAVFVPANVIDRIWEFG